MRKLTVTAFTLLYAVLILSASAERALLWAAKESGSLSQHQTHGSLSLGRSGKQDSHLSQTKLVETEFVVELPRQATASPMASERLILNRIPGVRFSPLHESISDRAPPFLT